MIGSRRVLAIIPARGGSKGVPQKNIQPVAGHPLIAWTVAAALAARKVDRVILSSDDEAIMAAAREAGCEVPFRRDASLSTDEAGSIDVLMDALERTPGFDVVVLLQPTSPLRIAEDIDGTLEAMERSGAPGCVSVCEATDHPWLTFGRNEVGVLTGLSAPPPGCSMRRQDLPKAYVLNGAVYAADVTWILKHRQLIQPGATAAYVMPAGRSEDIDTWEDLERADRLLTARQAGDS
jgi:CMP-N,N'-diacetyllegionaminic acid synthase